MSKAIVILSFAGTGKTCLARKYKNILDLDHLHFKYIFSEEMINTNTFEGLKGKSEGRRRNPLWPKNFLDELFKNIEKYKVILIPSSEEIMNALDEMNFKYILCYPEVNCKPIYLKRYRERGTNPEWIDKMDRNFEKDLSDFDAKKCDKIILQGDETLEDKLKQMNMLV